MIRVLWFCCGALMMMLFSVVPVWANCPFPCPTGMSCACHSCECNGTPFSVACLCKNNPPFTSCSTHNGTCGQSCSYCCASGAQQCQSAGCSGQNCSILVPKSGQAPLLSERRLPDACSDCKRSEFRSTGGISVRTTVPDDGRVQISNVTLNQSTIQGFQGIQGVNLTLSNLSPFEVRTIVIRVMFWHDTDSVPVEIVEDRWVTADAVLPSFSTQDHVAEILVTHPNGPITGVGVWIEYAGFSDGHESGVNARLYGTMLAEERDVLRAKLAEMDRRLRRGMGLPNVYGVILDDGARTALQTLAVRALEKAGTQGGATAVRESIARLLAPQ